MNKFNFKKIAIGLMIPIIFQSCFVSNVAGMEKTETSSFESSMMSIDDTIVRYVDRFQPGYRANDKDKEEISKVVNEIEKLVPSLFEKYNGSNRRLDEYLASYNRFLVNVHNIFGCWHPMAKKLLGLMYEINEIVLNFKEKKKFSFPIFENKDDGWCLDE